MRAPRHPTSLPGLLAFWDFQAEGPGHRAAGEAPWVLEEMGGPLARAGEGLFGPSALHVAFGQWLRIPRERLGALNIHGGQPLTVLAWVKPDSARPWQFLAGVWNEHDHRRQYALFYNGAWQFDFEARARTACARRVHAYLSREGGHTPGDPACFSYATGATELETGQWHCLGLTWDGQWLAAWANGRVDSHPRHNPMPFDGPIFDGGPEGADFTVAQRAMAAWHGYPEAPMPVEEGFSGLLGGLAIYQRALVHSEMEALASFP